MITTIKEFIPHQQAWDLAVAIDGNPSHWWQHTHKYLDGKVSKPTGNVNSYRFQHELDRNIRKSVERGNFTYRFHRTTAHKEMCPCWECTFRKEVLESEDFKDVIRQHTTLKNPVIHEAFTSAYHPGDFLGQHTDHKRGCAFIIHLSWKWKPEYGGLFMAEETPGNWTSYIPGWGDLVIMELGETGVNHLVTEVSDLAPRPRIAISGWYNEGD